MRIAAMSPVLTSMVVALIVALGAGCDDSSLGGRGRRGRTPVGDAGSAPPPPRGDAGDPDPPFERDASAPSFDECASVTVEASSRALPTDIVWVVDSSGSMDNEAASVQENMNRFAAGVIAAGIDPHVVVITSSAFVTVPPPLGTDPTHYLFIDEHVGSNAPLEMLLAQFSRYAGFLRPDAVLHFVAVTDDESDVSASMFDAAIRSSLGGREYVLHAIASEDLGGGRECPGAAAVGAEYYELATTTGGQQLSICTTDWSGVFMRLLEAVTEAAPLPCTLELPPPPDGSTLDPMRVNVLYQPGSGGAAMPLPFASSCGPAGGWHYDDPSAPTAIELCPTTCEAIAADTTGRLDVALGCETVLL